MATAVSACFVRAGRVGGAEHALYNLLDGLRAVVAADPWIVVTAEPLVSGFDLAPLGTRQVRVPGVHNRVAIETVALPSLRQIDHWLLPNYYTPIGLRGRIVTVIHDAQHEHFPENFSARKRAWLRAAHRYTMRRADTVVAISAFVATDLLRLHGDRYAGKVVLIPNAVSFDRLEPSRPPSDVPPSIPADREIVLCVSGNYRHKNLDTLVRAFADVAARRPHSHLVVVGQAPELLLGARKAAPVGVLAGELGIADRVTVLGYVSDAMLGALYRRSSVLAMPSLFEGFGLPVIEALGLGVPVVSTRCGALEEVSLGLARYVDDPLSASELAGRLVDVLAEGDKAKPTTADVEQLRARYDPAAVARLYRSAVEG
jgi:glycosyltransferase involved in cell wall biosynthesis